MSELTQGHRLRIEREKNNISQIELAEVMGMTQSALSNYENGKLKRLLPHDKLKKIEHLLDIEYIIHGEDGELKKVTFMVPKAATACLVRIEV